MSNEHHELIDEYIDAMSYTERPFEPMHWDCKYCGVVLTASTVCPHCGEYLND